MSLFISFDVALHQSFFNSITSDGIKRFSIKVIEKVWFSIYLNLNDFKNMYMWGNKSLKNINALIFLQ